VTFVRSCGKILQRGKGQRWQFGACVLHAEEIRLQTYTHNT